MSIALFIAALILIMLLAFAAVALAGRRSLPTVAPAATGGARGGVPASPARLARPVPPPAPEPPPLPVFDVVAASVASPAPEPIAEVTWYDGFDARSGRLDDTARLRLIGDLGVIAKEWCVPLLAQAYTQERRPGHRQAALIALAACRSRAAVPVFDRAVAAGDPAERAIATDALADLEPAPPPPPKRSRTVERY